MDHLHWELLLSEGGPNEDSKQIYIVIRSCCTSNIYSVVYIYYTYQCISNSAEGFEHEPVINLPRSIIYSFYSFNFTICNKLPLDDNKIIYT